MECPSFRRPSIVLPDQGRMEVLMCSPHNLALSRMSDYDCIDSEVEVDYLKHSPCPQQKHPKLSLKQLATESPRWIHEFPPSPTPLSPQSGSPSGFQGQSRNGYGETVYEDGSSSPGSPSGSSSPPDQGMAVVQKVRKLNLSEYRVNEKVLVKCSRTSWNPAQIVRICDDGVRLWVVSSGASVDVPVPLVQSHMRKQVEVPASHATGGGKASKKAGALARLEPAAPSYVRSPVHAVRQAHLSHRQLYQQVAMVGTCGLCVQPMPKGVALVGWVCGHRTHFGCSEERFRALDFECPICSSGSPRLRGMTTDCVPEYTCICGTTCPLTDMGEEPTSSQLQCPDCPYVPWSQQQQRLSFPSASHDRMEIVPRSAVDPLSCRGTESVSSRSGELSGRSGELICRGGELGSRSGELMIGRSGELSSPQAHHLSRQSSYSKSLAGMTTDGEPSSPLFQAYRGGGAEPSSSSAAGSGCDGRPGSGKPQRHPPQRSLSLRSEGSVDRNLEGLCDVRDRALVYQQLASTASSSSCSNGGGGYGHGHGHGGSHVGAGGGGGVQWATYSKSMSAGSSASSYSSNIARTSLEYVPSGSRMMLSGAGLSPFSAAASSSSTAKRQQREMLRRQSSQHSQQGAGSSKAMAVALSRTGSGFSSESGVEEEEVLSPSTNSDQDFLQYEHVRTGSSSTSSSAHHHIRHGSSSSTSSRGGGGGGGKGPSSGLPRYVGPTRYTSARRSLSSVDHVSPAYLSQAVEFQHQEWQRRRSCSDMAMEVVRLSPWEQEAKLAETQLSGSGGSGDASAYLEDHRVYEVQQCSLQQMQNPVRRRQHLGEAVAAAASSPSGRQQQQQQQDPVVQQKMSRRRHLAKYDCLPQQQQEQERERYAASAGVGGGSSGGEAKSLDSFTPVEADTPYSYAPQHQQRSSSRQQQQAAAPASAPAPAPAAAVGGGLLAAGVPWMTVIKNGQDVRQKDMSMERMAIFREGGTNGTPSSGSACGNAVEGGKWVQVPGVGGSMKPSSVA
eukprot:jgi/Mesen1/10615/ME000887S10132